MSYEQRAAEMSPTEVAALLARTDELKAQLEWFKRQLFGPKSERRPVFESGSQLWLGENAPAGTSTTGVSEPPNPATTEPLKTGHFR